MKKRFHTRQLTFRQLETFKEVAERLSVTEAAAALHLAQPTISTQIARITSTVGVPLFEHIGKRLFLTDMGRDLLATSRELFDAIDRLEMRLAQRAGLATGSLRICAVTTAKYLVPAILGPFCKRYPGIEVQFHIGNRAEVVARIEANLDDLYVFSHLPENFDLVALPFADNPLVVVAPYDHPLAGQESIQWEQLREDRMLVREVGSGTRHAIEQHLASKGERLKRTMTIASNEAIKESIAAGLGISILSRHSLRHITSRRLVELDVTGFPIHSKWYLVYLRSRVNSPPVNAFLEHSALLQTKPAL